MSLLRLLTTGKSLVGVTNTESRYRLTTQRLLPHFGGGHNPFSSKPKAEPLQAEPHPAEAQVDAVVPAPAPVMATSESQWRAGLQIGAGQRLAQFSVHTRALAGAVWQKLAGLLGGCRARLGRLAAPSLPKAAKPGIPAFPKPAVQGELSLERIKVVRNDLSDADLEVVRAKPAPAPQAIAPAPRASEQAARPRSSWGRVATHFMGAGKT